MSAVFVATGASSDAKPVGQDWVLSVPSVRWNRSRVAEHRRCRPTRRCGPAGEPARSTGSGGGTRTLDLTIMSRALSPTELPRRCRLWSRHNTGRAPKRNRTVDLLLTMETLYRLSYWDKQDEGTRRAATGEIRRPDRATVAGEGFEPSKAEPADLQSAPFGRSGNLPDPSRTALKS